MSSNKFTIIYEYLLCQQLCQILIRIELEIQTIRYFSGRYCVLVDMCFMCLKENITLITNM